MNEDGKASDDYGKSSQKDAKRHTEKFRAAEKWKSIQQCQAKRKRTGILTVSAAVILLCGALLFNSYNLSNRLDEYDDVVAGLNQQISEQQQESEELVKESDYVKTEEYMEQVAREKLGLVKENEIIFQKETS